MCVLQPKQRYSRTREGIAYLQVLTTGTGNESTFLASQNIIETSLAKSSDTVGWLMDTGYVVTGVTVRKLGRSSLIVSPLTVLPGVFQ